MRSNCLVDSDDAMDETCVTWYIREKSYLVNNLKKHSLPLSLIRALK